MKIFDPHIRSQTQSDDDLRNLHYFGTEAVVTTAYDGQPFETAADLIAYFEKLVTDECRRLRHCELEPRVALGVLPDARPRRAHYEVWDALEAMLERDVVVALGEIGVWEDNDEQWELFERQVRIARRLGPLPLLITPPGELKITMTYKMMTWLEKFGYPPSLVVMNHQDERLVENVVESGFYASCPVGTTSNKPREVGRHLAQMLRRVDGAHRVLLTAALRSSGGDVLGVPKTIVALQQQEVAPSDIAKMVYDNAARLFGPA